MSEFEELDRKKKGKKSSSSSAAHPVQRELEDVNGPKGGMLPRDISSRIQSLRGSGHSLSDKQQQLYSEKFGRDMSDVRIHTDAEADTISRSLNARAFTIGSDVFLTKGINPEGGGRDAETMTHELTHVVQQGGRAGFGQLRLGAADTAQEHEAEATAHREFMPGLSSSNTVQRGLGDWIQSKAHSIRNNPVMNKIGHNLLKMVGADEVYTSMTSGSNKVKRAIEKLTDADKSKVEALNTDIKKDENSLPDQKKEMEEAKKAYDETVKAAKQQGGNANIAPDDSDVQAKTDRYNSSLEGYEKRKAELMEILHKADDTITQDDVEQYRTGKGWSLWSMIKAGFAGNFLAGFESDPEEKKKARENAYKNINKSITSSQRFEGEKAEKVKRKVINAGEEYDTISLDEQTDALIEAAYTEVMNEEKNQKDSRFGLLKKSKTEIINAVKDDDRYKGADSGAAEKIAMKMLDGLTDGAKDKLNTALEKQGQIAQKKTALQLDPAKTLAQSLTEIQKELNATNEQIDHMPANPVRQEDKDRLEQLTEAKNKLLDKKDGIEQSSDLKDAEEDYDGSHKAISIYIREKKDELISKLNDPQTAVRKLDQSEFDEFKNIIRGIIMDKINAERTSALNDKFKKKDQDNQLVELSDTEKRDVIIADAWDQVQKDEKLKGKFKSSLVFRKTLRTEFGDFIMEMVDKDTKPQPSYGEIMEAVMEEVEEMASKRGDPDKKGEAK